MTERVFLDIDIDDWRAKYQLACDFVAATNLRYGLSSDKLEELGGSEKARLASELFPNDWEWSGRGEIVTARRPERIVIELWSDRCPLAASNFRALCTGEKGRGDGGKPLHYKGCPFHRVVKGFVAQGGDILFGNGTGGESVHGKKFKDDPAGLKAKFDRRGVVAMGNTGKNSNTSQFFFALAPQPKLNGKHVAFGEIVEGWDVLDAIEATATGRDDERPDPSVVVADCGVL